MPSFKYHIVQTLTETFKLSVCLLINILFPSLQTHCPGVPERCKLALAPKGATAKQQAAGMTDAQSLGPFPDRI